MDSSIGKVIPVTVYDSQMLIGEVIWMTENQLLGMYFKLVGQP